MLRCPKCNGTLNGRNADGDVECVMCGTVMYDRPLPINLNQEYVHDARVRRTGAYKNTNKEKSINLKRGGRTNKQIAAYLGISESRVRVYTNGL